MVTVTIRRTDRTGTQTVEVIEAEWAHVRDACLVYQVEGGSGRVMHRPVHLIPGEFEIYDPAKMAEAVKGGTLQSTGTMAQHGVPPVH